jgi:general secretion pathway protein K
MKIPRASSQSGIALVIVLLAIFVLTILAGGFAYSMKVETKLARNSSSETELEWLGRSAVECARWELAESLKIPNEPYDALNQVWAGGPGGMGTSNSPLADFKHEIETKNGKATWKITDLESKANINIADEAVLQNALMAMGVDAGEMTPVVNSILDWIDEDKRARIQSKEDYGTYLPKNGPIDELSELLMIPTVTEDLYWGPASTNHTPGVYQPKGSRMAEPQPFPVGLADLFTPISNGRININTASAYVLQLIPGVDAMAAQAIASARDGDDDGSGLMGPYRTVDQVRRVPEVNMLVARQIQAFGTTRSQTFQVEVEATVNGYTRHFTAVLRRENARDVYVLSFYWK